MDPNTQQDQSGEGSLRFLSQKSSDFSLSTQRIGTVIDSYPKNRRYVQLRLREMFVALVTLYASLFKTQWSYFKRVAENIDIKDADTERQRTNLARIYISHWLLDLYASVRTCVERLTPVAFTEMFTPEIPHSSFEYDVFLTHLNTCIRPTHVVGCYEDTMFIPKFADTPLTDSNNPWDIPEFKVDFPGMGAIVRAIKDKRAAWKTARLTNETVGRPIWLFDWHSQDRVCSWFPKEGNYTSEDVMYAYLIGVACTQNLAHTDRDEWQRIANNVDYNTLDARQLKRVWPRRYHGAYEVTAFSKKEERFTLYDEDEVMIERGSTTAHKRARTSRGESDRTQPTSSTTTVQRMESDDKERVVRLAQLVTYIYYSRVITRVDANERLNVLLGLILDEQAHHV